MTSDSYTYAYGHPEWQIPSPSGTPQSAPFSPFVFQTPSTSENSPDFGINWTPGNTQQADRGFQFQVPKVPSTPQYHHQGNVAVPASASSLKRPRPDSLQNIGKDAFNVPDVEPVSTNERFLSQSFLEQFDETTLHDSFNTTGLQSGLQSVKSTPYAQMQTPPPTRDTTTRRKAQQQNTQETPSTIASRRMSVAGESWRRGVTGTPMDASPYQFTPLQITPPVRSEIYNMGPTTAPVFSQSGLLWDPQRVVQSSQASYSVVDDDPFVNNGFTQSFMMNPPQQRPQKSIVPTPSRLTIPPNSIMDAGRPHSAGPVAFKQNAMLPPSSLSAASSVNPNMLCMSKSVTNLQRSRSNTVGSSLTAEACQPYQYHLDQMKREKTLEIPRKVSRQPQATAQPNVQSSNTLSKSMTSENPRAGLTRSMTESRIRTMPEPFLKTESNSVADGKDQLEGIILTNVPRTSSPLKRYRTEASKSSFSQSTQQNRQSVILTIDDKGRAQVTTVGNTPVESPSFGDDDNHSDGSEETTLTMKNTSTPASKIPAPPSLDCNDAHDALRKVVEERQRRKQSQSNQTVTQNYPVARSQSESAGHLMHVEQRKGNAGYVSNVSLPNPIPAYPINLDLYENFSSNSISPNNISPSTISEQELYTPTGFQGLGSTCICNVPGDNGQPMIRCECCYKWLHMTCVGLHPNHPPHLLPPYVCVSCATSQMFNMPGHMQMYPGGMI